MRTVYRNIRVVTLGVVCATVWPSGNAIAQDASARGAAVYQNHCAACHGRDGSADTPVGRLLRSRPRNFADPVEMARVTRERFYQAIERGIPGTAMAGWNEILSESEIRDVVTYIRSLVKPPEPPLTEAQLSAEVGRYLYEKECAACHGEAGRPDSGIAKALRPPPRSFADPIDMARVDDARLYAAIASGVGGTAMPSFSSRLAPAEMTDLVRHVRRLAWSLPTSMAPGALDTLVGAQVYHRYCAGCHGDKGDADTPLGRALVPRPWNFTDAKLMAALSDELMAEAILHGRPGTSMAPWGGILNAEDVRRVVLFIRQTFQGRKP